MQVSQEAGKVIWYSHLFKNFPLFVVIYIAKGFGIVNKADVFLNSLAFSMIQSNLISRSSAFSKSSLNTWNFTFHILLNAGLENFEHYFAAAKARQSLLVCEISPTVW